MQYSANSPKKSQFQSLNKYIFIGLFISFTATLFISTWKVQQTCHPLVGKFTCLPEKHSIIDKSWNATRKTASKVKNTADEVINKYIPLLPKSFLNH